MREYDQVFVYKQLFKAKKDASTQTNEGKPTSIFVGDLGLMLYTLEQRKC